MLQGLCGLQVYHQFEFDGLLDGRSNGFCALEDFIIIHAGRGSRRQRSEKFGPQP
jgi:hypothetical protein